MRCDSSNVEIGALATWPQSGWSWKVVKRCPGPNCLISIVGCGCRSHCGGIDAWPPCPRVANGASQCSRHPRNSDVKFTRSLYMIMLRKYLLYLSIYLSIYLCVCCSFGICTLHRNLPVPSWTAMVNSSQSKSTGGPRGPPSDSQPTGRSHAHASDLLHSLLGSLGFQLKASGRGCGVRISLWD